MGKHTDYSGSETQIDDQFYEPIEDMDDDEFFAQYEKPQQTRKRQSMRKRINARRQIEKYWEDKDLEERLIDTLFQTDD